MKRTLSMTPRWKLLPKLLRALTTAPSGFELLCHCIGRILSLRGSIFTIRGALLLSLRITFAQGRGDPENILLGSVDVSASSSSKSRFVGRRDLGFQNSKICRGKTQAGAEPRARLQTSENLVLGPIFRMYC